VSATGVPKEISDDLARRLLEILREAKAAREGTCRLCIARAASRG
jgi:hypothetical protein